MPKMKKTVWISELSYRSFFDHVRDGIMIIDHKTGMILDVNKFLIDLLDYSKADFLEKHLWEVGVFKDIAASKENFATLQKKKYIRFEDLPLETKTGKKIDVEFVSNVYEVKGKTIIQCNIRDITTREKTEAALKESQRIMKAEQVIAGIGTYVLNISTGIWEGSEVLDSIFGIDNKYKRSVEGWADVVHPEDRKMMVDYFANEVLGKHIRFDKEYRILRKNDGKTRWVHGFGDLDFGKDKYPTKMIGVIMDITERKKAEEQILDLAHIPLESPRPILRISKTGTILYNNPASEKMLGRWKPQIGGRLDPSIWKIIEPYSSSTESLELEIGIGGKIFLCLLVPVIYRGYLNIYFTDITKSKKNEEALKKSEARFRSYFDMPLHGIAISSPEKKWLEANNKLCSIFGYTHDEIIRLTWPEITYPDDLAADLKQFNRVLSGQIDHYHLDKRFIRKDKTIIWTSLSVGCVRKSDGGVDYLVVLVEDISARKQAEERLKELDRLKDDFLSVTTHELKTPLIPIKSQAQLLLAGDYGKLNRKQEKAVEMIYRNEENLNILTGEVLDVAKIKSNKFLLMVEKIDLSKIITYVINDLKNLAKEKNITISLRRFPEIPPIKADKLRIVQVLNNLIDNAMKFTAENGKMSIEVKSAKKLITVKVKDTGIGINPKNFEKLFLPFFQIDNSLNRKYRGTGLGLAICRGIIEAHGGKIWVESAGEGKGSTFCFTLPVVE